jgi:membrane protein YqaA with SNARE-associated domain
MIRHVVAGVVGGVLGATVGWVVGYWVGRIVYRDCVEMDCLMVGFYGLGGALLIGVAAAVVSVVLSVRSTGRSASQ